MACSKKYEKLFICGSLARDMENLIEQLLNNNKYLARAVKGGDLRSSADSAWVRIPQILLFLYILYF